MKATIALKPYIACPNCGYTDGFSCEHILNGEHRRFGPWHCDGCGHAIVGQLAADGSIDIEVHSERKINTVDLLVLKPQEKPVYFVVEGMRFEGGRWQDPPRDEADRKKFYYESYSCPTNWLKPTVVYHAGDADPHGLIEFVATRDDSTFPPDEVMSPNPRDHALNEFIEQFAGVPEDQ